MKRVLSMVMIVALACLTILATDDNDKVKINGNSLQLVSVTDGAEKCSGGKGRTVTLKVVGDSAVDILRYASMRNTWGPEQLNNQTPGSQVVTYSCVPSSKFVFFTRKAGSTDTFPKP